MSSFDDIIKDVVTANITEQQAVPKVTELFNREVAAGREAAARVLRENAESLTFRTHVTTFTNALAARDTSDIPTHLRDKLAEYVTEMSNIGGAIDDLLS